MKKLALAILAAALLVGCHSAPPAKPHDPARRVWVQQATVRAEPDGLAPAVGSIPYGITLRPCETNGNWLHVKLDGWVHASALATGTNIEGRAISAEEFDRLVKDLVERMTNGVMNTPGKMAP